MKTIRLEANVRNGHVGEPATIGFDGHMLYQLMHRYEMDPMLCGACTINKLRMQVAELMNTQHEIATLVRSLAVRTGSGEQQDDDPWYETHLPPARPFYASAVERDPNAFKSSTD